MSSLLLENICTAIAGLSVSGVDVLDTDEITASFVMHPGVLYPNTEVPGFVTQFGVDTEEDIDGNAVIKAAHYTLNYRYLDTAIGDQLTFGAVYGDLVSNLVTIVNAIFGATRPYADTVKMELGPVSIGGKTDPAGNEYHGADFALLITEQYL